MVLDPSSSATAAATLVAWGVGAVPADPWDAPYFGGPVYLGYRPGRDVTTQVAVMPVVAEVSSESFAFAPWDAPYFGGQVYFRYAALRVDGNAGAAYDLSVPVGAEDAATVARAEVDKANESKHIFAVVSSEADRASGVGPAGGDSEKRRGWLARLFRGELSMGRRA